MKRGCGGLRIGDGSSSLLCVTEMVVGCWYDDAVDWFRYVMVPGKWQKAHPSGFPGAGRLILTGYENLEVIPFR